ncbi:MAG: hypothetical protein CR217_02505 [Beijerinckiaceae bacterium]|nr:MAG: hypothetical protein CR217_02505 [Beijerinckiaceae bacterium]
MKKKIANRRDQLHAYKGQQTGLMRLFRRCAKGEISSGQFYKDLPCYWSDELNDRFTGPGFARSAKDDDRDDIVVEEIDRLREERVPTRKAFLSEMLCLRFPKEYPVWNKPVEAYLQAVGFKAPRKASDGVRYVDLAKKLRFSLLQNPDHPAQNLAELDVVIWLGYGQK